MPVVDDDDDDLSTLPTLGGLGNSNNIQQNLAVLVQVLPLT